MRACTFFACVLLTVAGCAGKGPIDLSKLPPIVITLPPDTPAPTPQPEPVRATLAAVVKDAGDGRPLAGVRVFLQGFRGFKDTNVDGYISFELALGDYVLAANPDGYRAAELAVSLRENTQLELFVVKLPVDTQRDLTIVVHDAITGLGIPGADCTVHIENGADKRTESRVADGSGFIHFPIPDVSVSAFCTANRYHIGAQVTLPPGGHRIALQPLVAQPVPPTPTPVPKPDQVCVGDPLSCVHAVAAAHRTLIEINTFESCAEFLGHVLAALGPDWGYVGKVGGESQHRPKGFIQGERVGVDGKRYFVTGVSHDAIKRRDGQVIDILGNAAANEPCDPSKLPPGEPCWKPGPANAGWNVVPPQHWRDSNPFVPSTAVPR